MTMSTVARSAAPAVVDPALTGAAPRGESAATPVPLVDVLFPLIDDEEWPPYPAEMVEAVLIAHDLAEIIGIPWFITDVSRGDIVQVRHDGIGYVGGAIVCRGGHSTVHVMATSQEELAPVVQQIRALGAQTASGLVPPMLTVDVPESCSFEGVLEVLTAAESMTCAFTVASRQHRAKVA